jgi:hypothetical protein
VKASDHELEERRYHPALINKDPRPKQIGERRLIGVKGLAASNGQATVVFTTEFCNEADVMIEIILKRAYPPVRGERVGRR